jgi:hypothetical protein
MSAVAATVQALLASTDTVAIVANRVWPVTAPQNSKLPNIVVHRIAEDEEMLLRGHSGQQVGRVSIEARASTFTSADDLGTVVSEHLKQIHLASFAGRTVSFSKQGTDVSDHDDDTKIHRRILDFYIRLA